MTTKDVHVIAYSPFDWVIDAAYAIAAPYLVMYMVCMIAVGIQG